MKYKLLSSVFLVGATLVAGLWVVRARKSSNYLYTIGIIQTASHPALDEAREGFIARIKSRLGDKVDCVVRNAQGSPAHAHAIAQRFHANRTITAFYVIGTPAAQAAVAVEHDRPVIIAAVSDPAVLGAHDNLCGVSDMINMQQEIAMLHALLPDTNTVALLYSSGEPNAIAQVKLMKALLEGRHIQVLELGVAQESDIPMAVSMACRNADVLLCPTDNTLAMAMELIASLALAHKKPLIACHNQAVKQGALAARGVDYAVCGRQAADSAYAVIVEHKKPRDLSVVQPDTNTIYVNQKTLAALRLELPDDLKKTCVLV